jgi:hypothetical protein
MMDPRPRCFMPGKKLFSLRNVASRPCTATAAPCRANSAAIACPMPRELPVTRATRPSSAFIARSVHDPWRQPGGSPVAFGESLAPVPCPAALAAVMSYTLIKQTRKSRYLE